MYQCSQLIGSRESVETAAVVDVTRTCDGYAAVLEGIGPVVVASGRPRPGDRCAVHTVGEDPFWGVPVVELVRMAGGGLFGAEDHGHGESGYMVGVVEGSRPGYVSIGGKEYRTDESLVQGSRIAYDFGPDGELRLVELLDQAAPMFPRTLSATVIVGGAPGDPGSGRADDPRSGYGVMVAETGDVFEVRMVGRNGRRLGRPDGDLEGKRMSRRMAALGGVLERTKDEWVWRIDMSKPFAGSREDGWVALVHLANWIKDSEGKFPGIFGDLRDWVSGRRKAEPPEAVTVSGSDT